MGQKNLYSFIFFGVLLLFVGSARLSAMKLFGGCCGGVYSDSSDPNTYNLAAIRDFEELVIHKEGVFIGYREVCALLKKLNAVLEKSPDALIALALACREESVTIHEYAHYALIESGLIDWLTKKPTPKTVQLIKAAVIFDNEQFTWVKIRSEILLYTYLQNPPCLMTSEQAKKLMSQEAFHLMMNPPKKIERWPINQNNPFARGLLVEGVAGKILESSKKGE